MHETSVASSKVFSHSQTRQRQRQQSPLLPLQVFDNKCMTMIPFSGAASAAAPSGALWMRLGGFVPVNSLVKALSCGGSSFGVVRPRAVIVGNGVVSCSSLIIINHQPSHHNRYGPRVRMQACH
ncbi:expressed unknown protein [Seminavis robusta]|uniref:Uncharacterized protein n=1 Tax=Seminavis robusta TaxID=568900 RepID=A0A9N8E7A5_9STRA|nr:expressed unknown protein [Seminavis robusta]|eukprot:Sro727_g193591.1  (124) ;mRNA; f:19676-20047